jgi:CBS domain-containing protein
MKVSEIMRAVVAIRENDSLEDAARLMLEHNLRGVPVINEEGTVSGFLSVSDYLAKDERLPFTKYYAPQLFGKSIEEEGIEKIYEAARTMHVKEIMNTNVIFVKEDDTVQTLVELLLTRDLNRVPVLRDDVPVGIVARFDLLRMMVPPKNS